jgi:hypothetical protein
VNSKLNNYTKMHSWKALARLLPCCLLPLALIGYTAKPAYDYNSLGARLEQAKVRAKHARELRMFLAEFKMEAPPIERYRELEALVVQRMPDDFAATDFYQTTLSAAHSLDLSLDSIVPMHQEDLGYPVGNLSVHECHVMLKGKAHAEHLTAFLAAMHREGQPVCVHGCKLHAINDAPGTFDFQLELGAFFLSSTQLSNAESGEDF